MSRCRFITTVTFLTVILSAIPMANRAWAQQVKLPRAKTSLLIAGFEGPNGNKGWKGIDSKITAQNVSEGKQALSFSFPKYVEGADKWPMIYLDWDNGKGYPVKDWTHYGKFTFDAWTSSNKTSDLAFSIEEGDIPGKKGWTRHYTLKPYQKNTIVVTLPDTKGNVDLSNIKRVVFFTSVSPENFTVTVDNLKLIPGDRLKPVIFDQVYPNYRNMIFPGVKEVKISAKYQAQEYNVSPSNTEIKCLLISGKNQISKVGNLKNKTTIITLPVGKIPAGDVKLIVQAKNAKTGEKLSQESWNLHKMTQKGVSSLKNYIDENNSFIADGKPFFPLGVYNSWYLNWSEKYLPEIADSPFNCILDYSANHKSKKEIFSYLDELQQKGLKEIYNINDLYPSARDFKDSGWEGIHGNNQIASAVINAYKNHPAILAWYLNDELPASLVPEMTDYYQRVSKEDPSRPCIIVLCNMPEVKYFPQTTDVMGVDPYPIPDTSVTKVSDWVDTAQLAVNGHKPVIAVLQDFAWYQHNSTNPDRSHIPSAEELKTGRAPTYEEQRCMTYLALTHGVKGILYWCYYDMRQLPQYQEMWSGLKKIGTEVKFLSPMLLSSTDLGTVSVNPSSEKIHTRLKKWNGKFYLIAVNSDSNTQSACFRINFKQTKTAKVLFENRNLAIQKGTLTDEFKPLEAHVYEIGLPKN